MSFISDFFGPTETVTSEETKKKSTDEDDKEESSSKKSGGSSSSFWSNLFGSGGAGSSLVSSAGSIGLGLVNNDGNRIKANFELELNRLKNDASLSQSQFKLQADRLEQEREAALSVYADQKREDTLTMVLIVGGLITVVIVTFVLTRRSPSQPVSEPAPKRRRKS